MKGAKFNSLFVVAVIIFSCFIFQSCEEEVVIKPPSKIRFDIASPKYKKWESKAGFISEISTFNQSSTFIDYTSNLDVGDTVIVLSKSLRGINKSIVEKILSAEKIPFAEGYVESINKNVIVNLNLKNEIELKGIKTNEVQLAFRPNEVQKTGSYFIYDIVEKIKLTQYFGDLYLHYVDLNERRNYVGDSIQIDTYKSFVIDNVEGSKFLTEKIENQEFRDEQSKVFVRKFRCSGEMGGSFQFYITNAENKFIWGLVLIDYEDLFKQKFHNEVAPLNQSDKDRFMDYLDKEIDHFIESFKWNAII
jgi:hypothetical protein